MLSIGVTYEQFWHGDPWLVVPYIEAHRITTERRNYEAWLQGLYNYEAFSVVYHNANRDPKKGQAAKNYPDKPHRITPLTEAEKADEEKRAWGRIRASLDALKERFDGEKGNKQTV